MSERPRTTGSVGALHPGLQCWHAAASALRQPSSIAVGLPRFRLNSYGRRAFQLLARWHATHSRILSGIQRAAQTVLGVYWKRTRSRVTSASSALGVLNDCALYKSTHSLTHSPELHIDLSIRLSRANYDRVQHIDKQFKQITKREDMCIELPHIKTIRASTQAKMLIAVFW